MPAVTAKGRSQVALRAMTSLDPEAALDAVRDATANAKGGGVSLLTSGVANAGAKVHVESERPDALGLSITSGKRIVELCTFSATASKDDGRTLLQVGGLERYKTSQARVFGFVPAGPKFILGYDLYKRFLDGVSTSLRTLDPAADISIAAPGAA